MAVKSPRWARSWSKVPLLDDAALREHEDAVHGTQGGEAVRDADHGAVLGEVIDGLLHLGLGLRVERGGGFVEHEDRRVADEGARDGDALALAAAQALAAFAEMRVVAVRQLLMMNLSA
jgi:hypothetical protein